jgi:hypothetical protein
LDPITTALQLAFFVLFAVSVFQFWRYRGPLELWVMAVFGSFAALFALTFLNTLAPTVAPAAQPVLVAMLLIQPYLVVRLIDAIQPVAVSIRRIALLGAVAAWAAVVLLPRAAGEFDLGLLVPLGTVLAVVYFFAVEIVCATWFARASRRRYGVARIRLASAAVATALFGASILIAGLSSVGRAPGAAASVDAQTVTRFLALVAAAGYFVAFVPPAWFRRFINRAASFQLVRSLVAPPTAITAGSLWTDLASTAREILGARRVSVLPIGGTWRRTAVRALVVRSQSWSSTSGRTRPRPSASSPMSRDGPCSSATTSTSWPTSPR